MHCISGCYPIKIFNECKKMDAGQVQGVTCSNNKKGSTLIIRGDGWKELQCITSMLHASYSHEKGETGRWLGWNKKASCNNYCFKQNNKKKPTMHLSPFLLQSCMFQMHQKYLPSVQGINQLATDIYLLWRPRVARVISLLFFTYPLQYWVHSLTISLSCFYS